MHNRIRIHHTDRATGRGVLTWNRASSNGQYLLVLVVGAHAHSVADFFSCLSFKTVSSLWKLESSLAKAMNGYPISLNWIFVNFFSVRLFERAPTPLSLLHWRHQKNHYGRSPRHPKKTCCRMLKWISCPYFIHWFVQTVTLTSLIRFWCNSLSKNSSENVSK